MQGPTHILGAGESEGPLRRVAESPHMQSDDTATPQEGTRSPINRGVKSGPTP